MSKRKQEEVHDTSYGHGRKWFRGSMISKRSFGSVYLATLKKPKWRLTHLPTQMAVKTAEISYSGSLQKERVVLANLQGCPYIRKCYGEEITTGENGEMIYNLLLEHGSGGTLADLIKKSGGVGLAESDVRHYTRCILLGLMYTHARDYVHRDLKPENIIVVPTNNISSGTTKYMVKTSDYGSAKKRRRFDPYLRGNVRYLSPEAVVENKQDFASDIWAVGCIVVEMLSGKSIWEGKRNWEVEKMLYKMGKGKGRGIFPKIPREISKEAKDFLKGCLERKAENRLTAEMLLCEPFLSGLDDGDEIEIEDEVEEYGGVYYTEEEFGNSLRGFSEADDESEIKCWSDDDSSFISVEEEGSIITN